MSTTATDAFRRAVGDACQGAVAAYADWLMESGAAATLADALFRIVLDVPAADAPRLAWADLVGGARGWFVRLQCELAALYQNGGRAVDADTDVAMHRNCRVSRLERYQHNLLKRHGNKWRWQSTGAVLGGVGTLPYGLHHFRRGFVEHVQCSAEMWLAHAAALCGAAPVGKVTLTTWPALEGYSVRLLPGHVYHLRGSAVERWFPNHHPDRYIIRELLAEQWPEIKFNLRGAVHDQG